MRGLLHNHHLSMIAEMLDSALPSTRRFWRTKYGCAQFADDPRPLIECTRDQLLITNDRPDPDLDRTPSAVNDAINQPGE